MTDLLKPGTYRLPAHQEAWLKRQAEKSGHVKKVHIIRQLIEQAMKKEGR